MFFVSNVIFVLSTFAFKGYNMWGTSPTQNLTYPAHAEMPHVFIFVRHKCINRYSPKIHIRWIMLWPLLMKVKYFVVIY